MLQALLRFTAHIAALWLIVHHTGLVRADGWKTLALAVVALAVIRALLRLVLSPLLLGATVVTLGLFSLVSGTLLSWGAFMLAPLLMHGFHVAGPREAFLAALAYGILSAVIMAVEALLFRERN